MLNPNFVCNHLDAFSAIYIGLGMYEWVGWWFGPIGCAWGRSWVSEGKNQGGEGPIHMRVSLMLFSYSSVFIDHLGSETSRQ